jgi:RNA recognition motif-containing protein
MSRRLYVGNLSFDLKEDQLREIFGQAGGVERAEVMKDRWTGISRGFGFVDMMTEEDAQCAINELDGSNAMGRVIRVALAKPKSLLSTAGA